MQTQFDKQQEEAEAYAQLESRMRFEAAVAYDIKEQEKQRIREESQKRQVGFIINKNEDNTDE